MVDRLVLLYRLRPGVDVEEYEDWVRTQDGPYVQTRPGVLAYTVTRLGPSTVGGAGVPFDYVEVVDVVDAATDQAEVAGSARGQELTAQWQQYTEGAAIVPAREVSWFRRDE